MLNGAKSGMMQMLIDMLGVDPVEIQKQALQFKDVMISLDNRLALLAQQNAAIMRALNIPEKPDEQRQRQDGNGQTGPEQIPAPGGE